MLPVSAGAFELGGTHASGVPIAGPRSTPEACVPSEEQTNMILILTPNIAPDSDAYRQLMDRLSRLPNIQLRVHREEGAEQSITEVYLIGNTSAIAVENMMELPGVERVVRVSEEYRVLGRHRDDHRSAHFEYQGLRFSQDTLHVFAGLCAVDTRANVE